MGVALEKHGSSIGETWEKLGETGSNYVECQMAQ